MYPSTNTYAKHSVSQDMGIFTHNLVGVTHPSQERKKGSCCALHTFHKLFMSLSIRASGCNRKNKLWSETVTKHVTLSFLYSWGGTLHVLVLYEITRTDLCVDRIVVPSLGNVRISLYLERQNSRTTGTQCSEMLGHQRPVYLHKRSLRELGSRHFSNTSRP